MEMHYSYYYRAYYCCYHYIGINLNSRSILLKHKGIHTQATLRKVRNVPFLSLYHNHQRTITTDINRIIIMSPSSSNNAAMTNHNSQSNTSSTTKPNDKKEDDVVENNSNNNDEVQHDENDKNNNNDDDTMINKLTKAFQDNTKISSCDDSLQQKDETISDTVSLSNTIGKESPSLSLLWDDNTISDTIKQIAIWILNDTISNIIIVCGAGISVNAGIPDFRTPGTGLYDNLAKYKLPYAEAIFDIDYYNVNPIPFIQLAKHIWPNRCNETSPTPTYTHIFLYLLQKYNKLLRIYTQNIDGLEFLAGIDESHIIECHGHFRTASCISCKTPATDIQIIQNTICIDEQVPLCPICKTKQQNIKHNSKRNNNNNNNNNNGYIKPDIVFFGESLPERFHSHIRNDIKNTDCCLILGTSLQVAPVSSIPNMVSNTTKRILLNREYVGNLKIQNNKNNNNNKITSSNRNKMDHNNTIRDLFHSGDCDESIMILCDLLGWKDELIDEHDKVTKLLTRQKTTKK